MTYLNALPRRLAIAAALILTIAQPVFAQSAPQKGGTLVILVQPEPPTLAAYQSTAGPIGQVSTKVYEGLLEYDFQLKPAPSLAQSWSVSSDGKTVTFKLLPGVKFHDGKPFSSADVQFTVMDVLKKHHPRGVNTFRSVTAVDTPDALTAVFRLSEPAPYMMMALSSYESPMLPKHVFGSGDITRHPNANQPVGTGPFKFVEWQKGQFMRFDRNPDYRKPGLPHLDRIVARFIADSGTRSAAIETQEAHMGGFNAIPPVDVKRLQALPHVAATAKGYEMQAPILQLDFDTTKPPFDDVKVRQAVAYAMDRKFVLDNIWFGFGRPSTGPVSSNFKANGLYTADVKNYNVPNGVELANKLLDDAGKKRGPDGVRFEIVHDLTPYGEEWRRFGEYTQQQLAKIGCADLAAPGLHELRLPAHQQLDPDLGRPSHRRTSPLPLGLHQAGNGVRQQLALELQGDRRADGQGQRRERPEEARRAVPRAAKARGRSQPPGFYARGGLRDRLQQEGK